MLAYIAAELRHTRRADPRTSVAGLAALVADPALRGQVVALLEKFEVPSPAWRIALHARRLGYRLEVA